MDNEKTEVPPAEEFTENTNSESVEIRSEQKLEDFKDSDGKEDISAIKESDTPKIETEDGDEAAETRDDADDSSASDSDCSSSLTDEESDSSSSEINSEIIAHPTVDSNTDTAKPGGSDTAESSISDTVEPCVSDTAKHGISDTAEASVSDTVEPAVTNLEVGHDLANTDENLNVITSASGITDVPIITTSCVDNQNDYNNDTNLDESNSKDQLEDLNKSGLPSFKSTSPPIEMYTSRSRTESSISYGSEYGDIRDSYASSFGDRFSVARSDWSGSSMRSSASSYVGSDHELDPDETRTPHRGRTTVRKKDEPEDIQEKRRKKAFHIVNEIRTTEETFVSVLKLVNESFRSAILRARNATRKEIVPNDVMLNILKHLPELQNLNEGLLKDFTRCVNEWDKNPGIADVFIKKGPFLKLYISYISEYESVAAVFDDARKKYPDFDLLTKSFESSPKCKMLALKHYMLKPVQRIPQYKLLLQDYLKQLNEDTEEYSKTKEALVVVTEVADHANENMKFSDNVQMLWNIQHSLIGRFEVIKPGRTLIKSGLLKKSSRKVMQTRMFFLFSDVMLYTTPVATGYKLNNVFPLLSLQVRRPNKEDRDDLKINEFSIITNQRSFIVSASTKEEKEDWLEKIEQAIQGDIKKRQTFDFSKKGTLNVKKATPVRQRIGNDERGKKATSKLGTLAPVWIPDDRVSMCMLCAEEFGLFFRRHHCRACGKIVCSYCSDNQAPLQYSNFKPERVCTACYAILQSEARAGKGAVVEYLKQGPGSVTAGTYMAKFKGFNWASHRESKMKKATVLNEVRANDENASLSGFLNIWRDSRWKKRWFVLKNNVLYTFKAPEDAAARESTALLGQTLKTFKSEKELDHVNCKGINPKHLFELDYKGRNAWTYWAESYESKEKWVTALTRATKQIVSQPSDTKTSDTKPRESSTGLDKIQEDDVPSSGQQLQPTEEKPVDIRPPSYFKLQSRNPSNK